AAVFPDISAHISGTVEGKASSTLPEAVAILAVLDIVPVQAHVTIHTDSQACVSKVAAMATSSITHKPWTTLWDVWNAIDSCIHGKNLSVLIQKVKAHSGDTHNESADELAKAAAKLDSGLIIASNSLTSKISFCGSHKNYAIQSSPRRYCRHITDNLERAKWLAQNAHVISDMPSDIDWKFTKLALHADGPMTGGFSSGPTCRVRSYSLKLFHLRLPTGQHLKENYPTIYETNECPFCSKPESQIHIWQ